MNQKNTGQSHVLELDLIYIICLYSFWEPDCQGFVPKQAWNSYKLCPDWLDIKCQCLFDLFFQNLYSLCMLGVTWPDSKIKETLSTRKSNLPIAKQSSCRMSVESDTNATSPQQSVLDALAYTSECFLVGHSFIHQIFIKSLVLCTRLSESPVECWKYNPILNTKNPRCTWEYMIYPCEKFP